MDFKSAVSTNFTIGAPAAERTPALQRNPGSACAQCPVASQSTDLHLKTTQAGAPRKKGSLSFPLRIWSGKRVSNSRPQPWQGCALPTELFPHLPATLTLPLVLISKPQIISLFFGLIRLQTKIFPITYQPHPPSDNPESQKILSHGRRRPYLEARSGVEPD